MTSDQAAPLDPDAFVRSISDQLAYGSVGQDLADNVSAALRIAVLGQAYVFSGASQRLIDQTCGQLALAIEPLSQHFERRLAPVEIDVGMRCAAMVIRSYATPAEYAEQASEFDLGMWFDGAAVLLNSMTTVYLLRRMEERRRRHGCGRFEHVPGPATLSTMH